MAKTSIITMRHGRGGGHSKVFFLKTIDKPHYDLGGMSIESANIQMYCLLLIFDFNFRASGFG